MIIKAIVDKPQNTKDQTIQFTPTTFPAMDVSGIIAYVKEPGLVRLLTAIDAVPMRGTFPGIQIVGQSYIVLPELKVELPEHLDREMAVMIASGLDCVVCTRLK